MKVDPHDVFKGKEEITCSYIPKFPAAAEREYLHFVNGYMRILKESLEEYLPEMRDILREDVRTDSKETEKERKRQRAENFARMSASMEELFRRIRLTMEQKMDLYDIARRMRAIANKTRLLTVKEWKKAIGKALGIDIFEDYYLGEFFRRELDAWITQNTDLIKSIPHDALGEMKQVIYEGYVAGRSVTDISRDIQKRYQVNRSKARLLARDQMGKLSADITEAQQRDAGVRKYTWRTSKDSRVRKDHRRLEGKTFSWDDPPVVDTRTGRRGHPGQDYQCRCIAVAVLERDNLHLPV